MRSSLSSLLLFREGFFNIIHDKDLVSNKEYLIQTPTFPYPAQQQFSYKNISFRCTANCSNILCVKTDELSVVTSINRLFLILALSKTCRTRIEVDSPASCLHA
jgi:hypothetical protein